MAVIFMMGLIKKNNLNDYWSDCMIMSTPWFSSMFPCDTFKRILQAFHIVDHSTILPKEDPSYRPSARVRPLLDYVDTICSHHYSPGQTLAVDETLVAGKVRNPVRQYLPNKHHARFGTIVWVLADSSNAYVVKVYVYECAKYDPTTGGHGTGCDVVMRLLEMGNAFDKGHHLLTDNLFTTFAAAAYLLKHNTYITGRMRRNQMQCFPEEIKTAKPKLDEKIYYRKDEYLTMSYKQKKTQTKPLVMLPTYCGAFDVPHGRRRTTKLSQQW